MTSLEIVRSNGEDRDQAERKGLSARVDSLEKSEKELRLLVGDLQDKVKDATSKETFDGVEQPVRDQVSSLEAQVKQLQRDLQASEESEVALKAALDVSLGLLDSSEKLVEQYHQELGEFCAAVRRGQTSFPDILNRDRWPQD